MRKCPTDVVDVEIRLEHEVFDPKKFTTPSNVLCNFFSCKGEWGNFRLGNLPEACVFPGLR